MVNFLNKANSYHGVFPHWMDGATGKTIPFSRKDDGADLVETSFLFQGLLCARQYFNHDNTIENELRNRITSDVERNRVGLVYKRWRRCFILALESQ